MKTFVSRRYLVLIAVLCSACNTGSEREPLAATYKLTWYAEPCYYLDNTLLGPGNLGLDKIKELSWAPGAVLQIHVVKRTAEHLIPNTESDFIRELLEMGVKIEFVHQGELMDVRFVVVRADKGERLPADRSLWSGLWDPGDLEAWTYFLDGRFLGEGAKGIDALTSEDFGKVECILVIYPWVAMPAFRPFQHEVPLRPVIDHWRERGIRVECLAEEWPRI